jgi:hypothetical protein
MSLLLDKETISSEAQPSKESASKVGLREICIFIVIALFVLLLFATCICTWSGYLPV